VETEAQLGFLANQGCDLAQGFLLAKPMGEDAYLSYLKNKPAVVEPLRLAAAQ
jgi:sensor c-di-GMP phosphodiesterase-like protein